MKPYTELSLQARLRRLHSLAVEALAQYDLQNPEIDYYAFETNLLFRVTTGSGERFMLRLASPGWRTFEDLCAEALWLDALARDTDIPVPAILPARTGEYVLTLNRPDIPQARHASLMRWVPGRLMGHYLTAPNIEKMGALFASLHQHGKTWQPPAGFTTRRFEHWLSRGEPNLVTNGGAAAAALPAQQRDLLEYLHTHVEQAYSAIPRSDLRVIHCDLWHDNIKLHRGVLYPIDFEDTVWGFRSHDIAMAMLDLLESTSDERYPGLLAAFWRGYTAHLPRPDEPIEPFQIGRLLWKINWVARFQPGHLAQMVEAHVPVLEHYTQTGQVLRPPAT
ncbi:MAG TPA: phosphotransferase [Anaerolineales bacterium]|nr:phosphotransferase [Anaerolineales bacterium]